jgi:hypothetical protein
MADIRNLPTLTERETLIQAGVEAQDADAVVRIVLNERYHIDADTDDPDLVRVELFTSRMDDVHEIGSVGRSGAAFWATIRELHQLGKAMIDAAESARRLMPSDAGQSA